MKIKRSHERMETGKRMRLTQTEDIVEEEADVDGFQGPSGRPKDDGDDDDAGNSASFTFVHQ